MVSISHTGKARESMYKSYRLLRENTDLPIECLTVPGENLAEIAWDYARKIKADLILVGSGKESLLSGFLNVLRSRVLQGLGARSLFPGLAHTGDDGDVDAQLPILLILIRPRRRRDHHFPRQQQLGDQPRPSRLMGCPASPAIIAMEIFMEEDIILKMRIGL